MGTNRLIIVPIPGNPLGACVGAEGLSLLSGNARKCVSSSRYDHVCRVLEFGSMFLSTPRSK